MSIPDFASGSAKYATSMRARFHLVLKRGNRGNSFMHSGFSMGHKPFYKRLLILGLSFGFKNVTPFP